MDSKKDDSLTSGARKVEIWQALFLFISDETLQMFKKWLTSSTCQKKEREANQHCSQVFRIWNTVTTENRRTLHDITDSKKIERLWYAKERNKPAGTLRSYISSCALFIDFLLVNGASKKMSPRCVSCKTYLKTLSKSLNKQANRRKIEIMTKDIRKYLNYALYLFITCVSKVSNAHTVQIYDIL